MLSVNATVTGSGDTQLLAAPTDGSQYLVLGYQISSRAAINEAQLKSGSNVMARTEGVAAVGGGTVAPPTTLGYFLCNSNEALIANLSAAGNVAFNVQYRKL